MKLSRTGEETWWFVRKNARGGKGWSFLRNDWMIKHMASWCIFLGTLRYNQDFNLLKSTCSYIILLQVSVVDPWFNFYILKSTRDVSPRGKGRPSPDCCNKISPSMTCGTWWPRIIPKGRRLEMKIPKFPNRRGFARRCHLCRNIWLSEHRNKRFLFLFSEGVAVLTEI